MAKDEALTRLGATSPALKGGASRPDPSLVKIYLSVPLTGITRGREYYHQLAAALTNMGHEVYTPHFVSDPALSPHLSPDDVWRIDRERVQWADAVVAYVSAPSLGMGMELAWAHEWGKRIVVLYASGAVISRLVRGIPNATIFGFKTWTEILGKLEMALKERAA